VLNMGRGKGVYLRRLEQLVATEGRGSAKIGLWGTEQSKLAARYAAKRQRSANIAVAMPHRLPFDDGVFSVVFCSFAPAPWEELCRVLKPGGAVVVARAGRQHLEQLHHLVSKRGGEEAEMSRMSAASEPKQFSSGLAEHYLRCTTEESYDSDSMSALLGMTPFTSELLACGELDASELAASPVTLDAICSTHRVWLGTGGEPE